MALVTFPSHAFGLDIGDLSFKIAFLKKKGNKIELKIIKEKAVPENYFKKGEIEKEKEVINFIKKFVDEAKVLTPYVVAVLPETKTFIKTIKIDNWEEIEKEIESNIPFRIDEVYFDWQKISENSVLIGLAPKNIVDSYLKVLKMANLKPVALEIESVAILRAIFSKREDFLTPRAILDLGATRSSLIIVDQETIQLTISLPFSGQDLTKEISSKLKISFEKAEEMKINYSEKDKNSELEKIILSFFEKLSNSLKTHIDFYQEGTKRKIEELILSGGGANLFKIDRFLEEKNKIKTKIANPLIKINIKPLISEKEAVIYTTAIGLALRGLEEKI
jgi:type IV pilus assembly protein PilM